MPKVKAAPQDFFGAMQREFASAPLQAKVGGFTTKRGHFFYQVSEGIFQVYQWREGIKTTVTSGHGSLREGRLDIRATPIRRHPDGTLDTGWKSDPILVHFEVRNGDGKVHITTPRYSNPNDR